MLRRLLDYLQELHVCGWNWWCLYYLPRIYFFVQGGPTCCSSFWSFLISSIDEPVNSFSCAIRAEDVLNLMLRYILCRQVLCEKYLKFVPCLPGVRRRLCSLCGVCDRRWYMCGRVFVKHAFFSSLLCICIADIVIDSVGGMMGRPTLSDDVGWEVWVGSVGGCTLGDGVTCSNCCWGMVSVHFNWSTSVMSSLWTGSLACNEGDIFEGGCVKILIISSADCCKKSSNSTGGKRIVVEKTVAVSQSLTVLVLGK